MPAEDCNHNWTMTNIRGGYIVQEACYRCSSRRIYFSYEDNPPKEKYREGEHIWSYFGSDQSVKFDLACSKCDKLVTFEELVGLMHCFGCTNTECNLYTLSQICQESDIWVYAALGHLPTTGEVALTIEKLKVLNRFFNDRLRSPGKKILILPSTFSSDPQRCYGEIIRDIGMLEMTEA
jgi:hypothetical protein